MVIATSFRSDAQHRIRNLEIPGSTLDACPGMTRGDNARVLGQEDKRPRHRRVGRLPARADAGSDDDRAAAHQGADRHCRGALRHRDDRLLLCNRGGQPGLARQSDAALSLFHHRTVHPVRMVGARCDPAAHAAGTRPAAVPPLSRRADRDLDADGGAGAAYRQHGIGGRARLRRADDLFHLHHPLDVAAGFLALHLHRRRRRRAAVLHGDVLSSGRQMPSPASSITPRAA